MERFIIQLKTRFGYEDIKIFFDKKLSLGYLKALRERGLNVRLIQVVR